MKPGWLLSIWDNVSSDDAKVSVAKAIRKHIDADLIDDGGEMKSEGHGIQEMKLCAEILSGGLRFPGDQAGYDDRDQKRKRCNGCADSCKATREYRDSPSFDVSITAPQPLRCYSVPHSDHSNHDKPEPNWLTYNLYIPIPILLGIVLPKHADDSTATDKLPPHVRYYRSVEELAEHGAHIGILLDDGDQSPKNILQEVAHLHPCLPFRLMLVTSKTIGNGADWAKRHQEKQVKEDQLFKYPEHIPNRRLRICGGRLGKELLSLLNPSDESEESEVKFLGSGGKGQERWDAIVLRAYDAWLRVYKPLPTQANGLWKLCIGFEHGGKTVADRWSNRLEAFKALTATDGPCVSAYVVSKKNKDDPDPVRIFSTNWDSNTRDTDTLECALEAEIENNLEDKSFLLFDNHGDALDFKRTTKPFDKGTRFYQKIGLKDGLTLFQSLESPPDSAFGFALFVYSLVEGALTRVAILDERVARATLSKDGQLFRDELHLYQIADLFPLFNFRRMVDGKPEPITLSRRLKMAADATKDAWLKEGGSCEEWKEIWENDKGAEGFYLDEDCCSVFAVTKRGESWKPLQVSGVDVLVIHEGIVDRLHSEKVWEAKDTKYLFSVAPFVVRTSGRGGESRHLRNALPFLEFTELSKNTYQGMNKPSLVKALLGTSGDTVDLERDGLL